MLWVAFWCYSLILKPQLLKREYFVFGKKCKQRTMTCSPKILLSSVMISAWGEAGVSYLVDAVARLWACAGVQRLKCLSLFGIWEMEGCSVSITRCHDIECATWAPRLLWHVEVTGLANGLNNVCLGSVRKKVMGFIWMKFNILMDCENFLKTFHDNKAFICLGANNPLVWCYCLSTLIMVEAKAKRFA